MTHDELLARIDDDEKFLEQYFGGRFKGQAALRAVVELAGKDIEHDSYAWLDGYDYAMKQIIKAIEKELQ